jgi:hypothetical protein
VEVGHHVICVVHVAVDGAFARTTPVTPPTVNTKINPMAHCLAAVKRMEPPHMVAIHENTFTPVSTAITIVANTK